MSVFFSQPLQNSRTLFLAVVVIALLPRFLYLYQWHDNYLFSILIGDSLRYYQWGSEIAAGNWYGNEVFYQAPLYPYFLALIQTLFGDDLWAPRIIQIVMGSMAAGLIAISTLRRFGIQAGMLAGFLLAFYPPAIFFDGILQKSSLMLFLLTGLLWIFSRFQQQPGYRDALLTGLLLALLALTQEQLLVLIPVVLIWMFLPLLERPLLRRLQLTALVLAGLASVLIPVGLRNMDIGGTFLITTSQFGSNFYIGNNTDSHGSYKSLAFGRGDARYEREDAKRLAEQAVGTPLTPKQISDYWFNRALVDIRADFPGWLALMGKKIMMVWHNHEWEDTESLGTYRATSSLLNLLAIPMGLALLVSLAIIGIWQCWRDWKRDSFIYFGIGAITAGVSLFFIFARYRYPLVPLVIPFSAWGGVTLYEALRHRKIQNLIIIALLLFTTTVLTRWPLPIEVNDSRALAQQNIAARLLEQDRYQEAEDLLKEAIRIAPTFAEPHFGLSLVYRDRGDLPGERDSLLTGLRLQPDYIPGWQALGDVELLLASALRQQGKIAEVQDLLTGVEMRDGKSRPETRVKALMLHAQLKIFCSEPSIREPRGGLHLAKRAVILTNGEDANAFALVALAHIALGEMNIAIKVLEPLKNMQKPSGIVILALAQLEKKQAMQIACLAPSA